MSTDHTQIVDVPKKLSRKAQIWRLARKYWFVLPVVLVVAIGVALVLQRVDSSKRWSDASAFYDKAQYDKAAALLKDAPVPTDQKRLKAYAQTMLAVRNLDKALPAYRALYDKDKSPDTLIKIGNIYNEQQKYDKAAEVYQSVINTNASYIQAYVNLATVQRLQGKPDAAIATAKKGVEANPGSAVAHELYVSMLLEKQNTPEFAAAVAALKKLNSEDPLLVSLGQKK